jgi:hypothetical protein
MRTDEWNKNPMNIDCALANDLVHVVERDDRHLFYRLKFGELKRIVTYKLFPIDHRLYGYIQSHHMWTPCQKLQYHSSHASFEGRGRTLNRAIYLTAFYYRLAVRQGHDPHENWLWPWADWPKARLAPPITSSSSALHRRS